jgi:hypothetical protein
MPKKTKQIIPAKKALKTDKDYQSLLDELKSIIAKGQYQAYNRPGFCLVGFLFDNNL